MDPTVSTATAFTQQIGPALRALYLVAFFTTAGDLLGSLAILHRLTELHHGYYGILLAAATIPVGAHPHTAFLIPVSAKVVWTLRLMAFALVVDDTFQHDRQAKALLSGEKPPGDFSPLHRAYVSVYRTIHRWLFRRDSR